MSSLPPPTRNGVPTSSTASPPTAPARATSAIRDEEEAELSDLSQLDSTSANVEEEYEDDQEEDEDEDEEGEEEDEEEEGEEDGVSENTILTGEQKETGDIGLNGQPPIANGHPESNLNGQAALSQEAREEKEKVDIEALKSHMGEIAARISSDVEAMESKTSTLKPGDAIIIPVSRHDKLLKTVFGFTVHCKCLINDEVRMTIWILAIVACICGIAFFIADVQLNSISASDLQLDERYVAITIAGTFSFLASVLSVVQIRAHYANWVHPASQKCVVRILLMVPVYAISAWLSLVFLKWSSYIDFIRVCYEAFVIYTFMILLTKYLGGHNGVVEWMKGKQPLHWPAPFCCFMPVQPGSTYLYWLKYGTLQYTILAPIIALLAMTLSFFNLYGDGDVDWTQGYVYIAIIQNFSQLTSLYCLVWLYAALRQELNPFSPLAKFLVVKSVVFFTWWQSISIAFLFKYGILTGTGQIDIGQPTAGATADETSNQLQIGLQDFLVCIEMFIAAAAHRYTFGVETYANGTMKLLMDQRAMYLAEVSYKRAKEEQMKEQIRLEIEKRLADGESGVDNGQKKKKRKSRRNLNGNLSESSSIDSSMSAERLAVDIDMSNPLVAAAVKEAARQMVEDEDEDVVGDEASEIFTTTPTPAAAIQQMAQQQREARGRRSSFKFEKSVNPSGTGSPGTLSRTQSSLKVVGDRLGKVSQGLDMGTRTVIATTKKWIAPVKNFFIDEEGSALFDEDAQQRAFSPPPSEADVRRIEMSAVRRRSSGGVQMGDFTSGSNLNLLTPNSSSTKGETKEEKEEENPFNKV